MSRASIFTLWLGLDDHEIIPANILTAKGVFIPNDKEDFRQNTEALETCDPVCMCKCLIIITLCNYMENDSPALIPVGYIIFQNQGFRNISVRTLFTEFNDS